MHTCISLAAFDLRIMPTVNLPNEYCFWWAFWACYIETIDVSFRTLNTTRIAGACTKRALVRNNAIKCENSLTFFCTYKKYPNCHYLQHTMSIKLAFCMSIFFHFWSCLFLILPSFFQWYLCFPWCAVSTLFLRLPLWQTSQDFQLSYM